MPVLIDSVQVGVVCQMVEVQDAVEVVHFVFYGLCEQVFGVYPDGLFGVVERAEPDPHGPVYESAVSHVAETALLYLALALSPQYLGVDVDARLFFFGDIYDDQPPQLADLIRRQPGSASGAHGVHHVVGEAKQLLVYSAHPLGALPQNGMGNLENIPNRQ